MSPLSTTRRRADAFQAALEDASTGTDDARYADLVAVVAALREAPGPVARPEFVGDLRSRLVAAAETALSPETPVQVAARRPTPRRTRREKQVAAVVGGFAIVTASATMSVASQSALPGDTLYPLKRALENVQTGVTRSDDGKAASLLERATGRLAEVDQLSRADDLDAPAIERTLGDFVDQATEASGLLLDDYAETGSDASIEELRDFAATSMTSVEGLQAVLPEETRGALAEVADLIEQIDREAVAVCPLCGDALPAIASALADAVEAVEPALPVLPRPDRPGRDQPADPAGASQQGQQQRPDRPVLPVVPDLPLDPPASTTQPSGQPSSQPSSQPDGSGGSGSGGSGTGGSSGGDGGETQPDVLPDTPLLPGTGGGTASPGTGSGGDDNGGGRGHQGGANPLGGVLDGQVGDIDLGDVGGLVDDAAGAVGGLLGDDGTG